ncbi:hypothetical protein JHK82_018722 [Glycine max]|nr:hypothetical protein JHK85_019164 [Glycine max]KAG5037906.1 hypothetical protein JHK86_018746 [Glycine max]KAG5143027.1 hypothetical protein JHK82_018722 [Glycine max]
MQVQSVQHPVFAFFPVSCFDVNLLLIVATIISLDYAAAIVGDFSLKVLNKNDCLVEGVLHLPGNPPVKLDSQDLLQIRDKEFYFLLLVHSILARPAGPRHYPNYTTLRPVVPHYNNYHLGPGPMKKES